MPAPHRTPSATLKRTAPKQTELEQTLRGQAERRSQIRGLLLLGAILLIFILLHAGLRNVFTPGWWRVW